MNRILILLLFWSGQNVFLAWKFSIEIQNRHENSDKLFFYKKSQSAAFWKDNCKQKTNFNFDLIVTGSIHRFGVGCLDLLIYCIVIKLYYPFLLKKRPCENTALTISKNALLESISPHCTRMYILQEGA